MWAQEQCARGGQRTAFGYRLSPYTLLGQDLSYFCFCEAYSKIAGLQASGLCSCLCLLTAEIKGMCHHTYWVLVLNGFFLFIINPCNYQLSLELFQQPECLVLSWVNTQHKPLTGSYWSYLSHRAGTSSPGSNLPITCFGNSVLGTLSLINLHTVDRQYSL